MPSWLKEGRGSLCGANVSLLLREMGITKPLLVAGERTKTSFSHEPECVCPCSMRFIPIRICRIASRGRRCIRKRNVTG